MDKLTETLRHIDVEATSEAVRSRLARYALERNRALDRMPRLVTFTDDECAVLLSMIGGWRRDD